jgi:hypothetical protein
MGGLTVSFLSLLVPMPPWVDPLIHQRQLVSSYSSSLSNRSAWMLADCEPYSPTPTYATLDDKRRFAFVRYSHREASQTVISYDL